MKENLYLVGFMGTGKTTVARELARQLGVPCTEMDERIVEREGCSISETFAKRGEGYFRDVESAVLAEIAARGGQVVSCGGGIVLREENRRQMRSSGLVVWLTAEPETVWERVRGDDSRPVIRGMSGPEELGALMEKRREAYEAAAHAAAATDERTPEEIAAEILRLRETLTEENYGA